MENLKQEITDYWTGRVEQFEALRLDEYFSDLRVRWEDELSRHLSPKEPLDILDIGTGTGFFSFILASQGHRVTGIDLTEAMITGARRTSKRLGLYPDFRVMDAEHPDFESGRFDAIVTRNLTTFLPNLAEAYGQWHRLLKDGGKLINFDGDYYYDESSAPLPENHAHKALTAEQNAAYAHISAEMKGLQHPRPLWDMELLFQAGFREIHLDRDVYRRIYTKIDRFYNPTPIFSIVARK